MLKHELIEAVANKSGQHRDTVRGVLEAINSTVLDEISKGGDVMLAGLGKIYCTQRGPRKARNIRTGEDVVVPARRCAAFRPSTGLQQAARGE